jgi:hypothetical protein
VIQVSDIKKYIEKNKELENRINELEKIIGNYIDIVIHQRKIIEDAKEFIFDVNPDEDRLPKLSEMFTMKLLEILEGEDNE